MKSIYDLIYTSNIPDLLFKNKFSVLITTYQVGKLIAISSTDGKELIQTPVSLKKPMGIALQGTKMAVACLDEIRFFSSNENVHEVLNFEQHSYDLAYTQRATYNTGILDIHDLEFGDGMIWGVNTLLSCLSVYDINHSFRPKWKPPFIDLLIPEDHCHLNGMAMEGGLPKFVTALSKTNFKQGWREDKMNSGVLLEVPSGEILLYNLAMPHSPRIYNDKLYLLESGKGNLLEFDRETKTAKIIFNFGCFIRGMAFIENVIVIGKSKIRETSKDFNDLKVKEMSSNAGLIFFDILTNQIIGQIDYTSTVEEIFDVKILINTNNPAILTEEIEAFNNIVTYPGNKFWKKDDLL